MSRSPAPIHVVPATTSGEHRASSLCACEPLAEHDLQEPARLVYIHRSEPGQRERGIGAEQLNGFGGLR